MALGLLALGAIALGGGALGAADLTAGIEGPAAAWDNTPFDATYWVANGGDAAAPPFEGQFFVDGSPSGSPVSLGPLTAAGNGSQAASFTLPCGEHLLRLFADSAEAVAEDDESNNNGSRRVVVAPFANFSSSFSGSPGELTLSLDASASHGCAPLNFTWQVGSDTRYEALVSYTPLAGNLTVNLTVRSQANASLLSTVSRVIVVPNAAPFLTLLVPDTSILTLVPLSAAVEASDLDGAVVSYFVDFGDGNTTALFPEANGYQYFSSGNFSFSVTVTDNLGATNTSTVALQVSNRPPVAESAFDLWYTEPGKTVKFNASHSADPEGFPLAIRWEFGDGTNGTGVVVNHSYAEAGTYTVTLTVTDAAGGSNSAEISIRVERPASDGTPLVLAGVGGTAAVLIVLYIFMRRRKATGATAPGEGSSSPPPSP